MSSHLLERLKLDLSRGECEKLNNATQSVYSGTVTIDEIEMGPELYAKIKKMLQSHFRPD